MNTSAPFGQSVDDELLYVRSCRLPVSNHFPPRVRDALVAASRTSTYGDPLARLKAINQVVERARLVHPELFHL